MRQAHFDQIIADRRDEHLIEFEIFIFKNVFQCAAWTEVADEKYVRGIEGVLTLITFETVKKVVQ
jgi:hypothetical protein